VKEVHRDVQIKNEKCFLTLLPINENEFKRKVNTSDNTRLDMFTRGLWNSCWETFFDNRRKDHASYLTVLF